MKALKDEYKDDVFDPIMKPMFGKPTTLNVDEDMLRKEKPKKCYTARKCATNLEPLAAIVVNDLIKAGFIRKLPPDTITDFCAPGQFHYKKNRNKARMTCSFIEVNKYLKRSPHPLPSIKELIQSVPHDAQFFYQSDLLNGYFQIPLDEESQLLTTTILPHLSNPDLNIDIQPGLWAWTVNPQGIKTASDAFNQRTDEALLGKVKGMIKCVDDILITARTEDELMQRIREYYEACKKAGIQLANDKCRIGHEVTFCGVKISNNGIRPDESKIDAIVKAKRPTDLTSLRSLNGLINQVLMFRKDISDIIKPMNALLKKGAQWVWTADMEAAFMKVKEIMKEEMVIHPYNKDWTTSIYTDGSNVGIGFALVQTDPETGYKHLIQAGSRSLTDTETRYETVSIELLAILFAVRACKHYLLASPTPVMINTDCRAILGVMRKNVTDMDNKRLMRMKMELDEYDLTFQHVAGIKNQTADYLSRYPIEQPRKEDYEFEDELKHITGEMPYKLATDVNFQYLIEAAENDKEYEMIVSAILDKVNIDNLPTGHPAHKMKIYWEELSVDSGLIIKDGKKVYVPAAARRKVLNDLHLAHLGYHKQREYANKHFFWHGMAADIKNITDNCEECQLHARSTPDQPIKANFPCKAPQDFQCMDMAQLNGQNYLILVDKFSMYPFCKKMKNTTSKDICKALANIWDDLGYPKAVLTDNAPNFVSEEMRKFLMDHNVKPITSSPYHQSGNAAEIAVGVVKNLIKKCKNWDSFKDALTAYRDAPLNGKKYSPSELYLGRELRTSLPIIPGSKMTLAEAAKMRLLDITNEDKEQRKKGIPLKELQIGQIVRVQDPITKLWDIEAKIVAIRDNNRSYVLFRYDTNTNIVRNRKFIKVWKGKTAESSDKPTAVKSSVKSSTKNPVNPTPIIPLKPTLRRSARIANKAHSVTNEVNAEKNNAEKVKIAYSEDGKRGINKRIDGKRVHFDSDIQIKRIPLRKNKPRSRSSTCYLITDTISTKWPTMMPLPKPMPKMIATPIPRLSMMSEKSPTSSSKSRNETTDGPANLSSLQPQGSSWQIKKNGPVEPRKQKNVASKTSLFERSKGMIIKTSKILMQLTMILWLITALLTMTTWIGGLRTLKEGFPTLQPDANASTEAFAGRLATSSNIMKMPFMTPPKNVNETRMRTKLLMQLCSSFNKPNNRKPAGNKGKKRPPTTRSSRPSSSSPSPSSPSSCFKALQTIITATVNITTTSALAITDKDKDKRLNDLPGYDHRFPNFNRHVAKYNKIPHEEHTPAPVPILNDDVIDAIGGLLDINTGTREQKSTINQPGSLQKTEDSNVTINSVITLAGGPAMVGIVLSIIFMGVCGIICLRSCINDPVCKCCGFCKMIKRCFSRCKCCNKDKNKKPEPVVKYLIVDGEGNLYPFKPGEKRPEETPMKPMMKDNSTNTDNPMIKDIDNGTDIDNVDVDADDATVPNIEMPKRYSKRDLIES